ncbi:hypothetical protein BST11_15425 [Mycobacterium alsense]|nr:hypothetical protein BST11_15425 [Mycobacterium alsense]
MLAASDTPEVQAHPVQLPAASDTVTEKLAGLEAREVTAEVVSTRGPLGGVGRDGLPAGSPVGRGDFADYPSPHAALSPNTFDDQNLSQGALPDPVPTVTQMLANHVGDQRMIHTSRSSPSDVADGTVAVSPALPVSGDLFSAAFKAEIGELQTTLLYLLVVLDLKLVLLQAALVNALVTLSRT